MSNIRSFKDIKDDKKDNKKKDDKKTTNSYIGGQSSGLDVENPSDDEAQDTSKKPDNKIKLTVWKNGFQIDDGEFRDLSVPDNKKFMDEVEKGYIPQELVSKGMKNLGIMLEDKK